MKKILHILIIGVLLTLSSPQLSSAQRIEYDSTGIPHACTNYAYHEQQNQRLHASRLLIYAGAVVGIVVLNQAVYGRDEWNRSANGLSNQAFYAAGAAVGACLIIELYRFDVKLKNNAGL